MSRLINVKTKGSYDHITEYLKKASRGIRKDVMKQYAERGVEALRSATPIDTGMTADSWYYEISDRVGSLSISFHNSNIQNGIPIAIILQYGHGTGNGGYVAGRDYINPAIQPVFDKLAEEAWKEVAED